MKKEDFANSPAGRVIQTPNGHWAFAPHPLPPPGLDMTELSPLVSEADRFLGRLDFMTEGLPNPMLLIYPLQTSEARASSAMEGTYTSFEELILFPEVGERPGRKTRADDTREVDNYIRALHHGIEALEKLPVCVRLIRNMHGVLMDGLPPHRSGGAPGELKQGQNYIGNPHFGIEDAVFVPPPPQESEAALYELESYIQSERFAALPPLVQCALIHYQFETIHPFGDGNGRLGRLLIPLILLEKKILKLPVLYMSPWLERHKDEYVNGLQAVHLGGDWQGWIRFFLVAARESCREGLALGRALRQLREDWHEQIRQARTSALANTLVDILFERPAVTAPYVSERLGVTLPPAHKLLKRFEAAGILERVPGYERPRYYLARPLLNLLEAARRVELPVD